jgi:hypothetical protein
MGGSWHHNPVNPAAQPPVPADEEVEFYRWWSSTNHRRAS